MRISDWSSDVCSSDLLDRRIIQLKIEREALKKETDTASRERLGNLEKELHELEERATALTAEWQAEKDKLQGEQQLKEQLDAARVELARVRREGDLTRAAELTYGVIPDLERNLATAADGEKGHILNEEAIGRETV